MVKFEHIPKIVEMLATGNYSNFVLDEVTTGLALQEIIRNRIKTLKDDRMHESFEKELLTKMIDQSKNSFEEQPK